jgi:porphobilinogen synthase
MDKTQYRRLSRTRHNNLVRELLTENKINSGRFIYPIIIVEGNRIIKPINEFTDLCYFSSDMAVEECKKVLELGIPAVYLYGIPNERDDRATRAYFENGVLQRAVREIKSQVPAITIITDVCLCNYNTHSSCGIIKDGRLRNHESITLISTVALTHSQSGADIVSSTSGLDGAVAAIREKLDLNGFSKTPIMSCSAKFNTNFEIKIADDKLITNTSINSASIINRSNSKEAIREYSEDVREGADILMVSPSIYYADIITKLKQRFELPVASYQTYGEYLILKKASETGIFDFENLMKESLYSIKRSGADLIITYFAKQFLGN